MRERYEKDLRMLHNEILKMGLMVEQALEKAMETLRTADTDAAEAIITADAEIDSMEALIEEHCAMIIAREQPLAGDLRDIIAILKVSSELERMGDHARSLAKSAGRLGSRELSMALPSLESMITNILAMNREALEAFTDHDENKALQAAERDVEINKIHDTLREKLIAAIKEDKGDVENIVYLLFLNRFLERLGDRITNMCECIYYARTGNRLVMQKNHNL